MSDAPELIEVAQSGYVVQSGDAVRIDGDGGGPVAYVRYDLYDDLRKRLHTTRRTSHRRKAAIKQLTHAIDRRNRVLRNLWDRLHKAEADNVRLRAAIREAHGRLDRFSLTADILEAALEDQADRGGTRRQQGGSVPPPPTTLTAAGDLSGEYMARAIEEIAILGEKRDLVGLWDGKRILGDLEDK